MRLHAELWAEANPLEPGCVARLAADLAQLPPERKLAIGIDSRQAQALSADSLAAVGTRLQVGPSYYLGSWTGKAAMHALSLPLDAQFVLSSEIVC